MGVAHGGAVVVRKRRPEERIHHREVAERVGAERAREAPELHPEGCASAHEPHVRLLDPGLHRAVGGRGPAVAPYLDERVDVVAQEEVREDPQPVRADVPTLSAVGHGLGDMTAGAGGLPVRARGVGARPSHQPGPPVPSHEHRLQVKLAREAQLEEAGSGDVLDAETAQRRPLASLSGGERRKRDESATQEQRDARKTAPVPHRPLRRTWMSARSPPSAPGRTRTCDPRLRRPMLYPAELQARLCKKARRPRRYQVSDSRRAASVPAAQAMNWS
jgi:hypothetical protein